MLIYVDMDDTLEQLVNGWTAYLNEKYGLNVDPEDVRDWDLAKAFPTLTREQVYDAERDDHIWDFVKPTPGADEALRKMIADGHEVYIASATYYETLRKKMEDVLFRYFPYIDWDHVIITSHKELLKGDVLIDDGPHNMVAGGDYAKILFTARHNHWFDEKSVGAIRVDTWEEAYQAVCKIAKEKQNEV